MVFLVHILSPQNQKSTPTISSPIFCVRWWRRIFRGCTGIGPKMLSSIWTVLPRTRPRKQFLGLNLPHSKKRRRILTGAPFRFRVDLKYSPDFFSALKASCNSKEEEERLIPDFLISAKNLILEKINSEIVANEIIKLCDDKAKIVELGANGEKRVLREFSEQVYFENWIKLINNE